jgi:hypothetical protein
LSISRSGDAPTPPSQPGIPSVEKLEELTSNLRELYVSVLEIGS